MEEGWSVKKSAETQWDKRIGMQSYSTKYKQ